MIFYQSASFSVRHRFKIFSCLALVITLAQSCSTRSRVWNTGIISSLGGEMELGTSELTRGSGRSWGGKLPDEELKLPGFGGRIELGNLLELKGIDICWRGGLMRLLSN